MMSTIVILGWGSLIWDLDDLAPKVRGDWAIGVGPVLPIEFSRISPKRENALVAVIDPFEGAPCATCVIESAAPDLKTAAKDLAERERALLNKIGWTGPNATNGDARVVAVVEAWRRKTGFGGAVWTHLDPNFKDRTGGAFSHVAAIAHLKSLPDHAQEEAARYITQAPPSTDTPFRRALAADPWWRKIASPTGEDLDDDGDDDFGEEPEIIVDDVADDEPEGDLIDDLDRDDVIEIELEQVFDDDMTRVPKPDAPRDDKS